MKSWPCTNGIGGALAAFLLAAALATLAAQHPATSRRANELTLGGLRPGTDTQASAEARHKRKFSRGLPGDPEALHWFDACNRRRLRVDVDEKGVIQSVTVALDSGKGIVDCFTKHSELWRTGRGLAIADPRNRVIALYGEPNSVVPSVEGTREVELLFYAFDWAGPDVPQVMEVTCARETRRVIKIMLAFPSL